jgi:hypothetical protein
MSGTPWGFLTSVADVGIFVFAGVGESVVMIGVGASVTTTDVGTGVTGGSCRNHRWSPPLVVSVVSSVEPFG